MTPVRIAVNDQRGHVDPSNVLAEVFMPGWHACKTGRGRGSGCHVPARLHSLFAHLLAPQQVRVIEILEKLSEEHVSICDDRFLDSLKAPSVHAPRVVRSVD